MKFFGGILVLSITLLSLFQAESHFVKPWHLCKTKEVTDPPTPCTLLECSGLCSSLYPGGLGICIAEVCQCLHSCLKEGQPPRDTKLADDKVPKMAWSSSSKDLKPDQISKMVWSSSSKDLKPDRISKMALSSSKDNLKPDQISKMVWSSSSKDLKPDRISKMALSSSKDNLKPDQISKVAFSSSMPINKPDRISNAVPPVKP